MRNVFPSLFTLSFFLSCSIPCLQAETDKDMISNKSETSVSNKSEINPASKLEPFTGKVTKNRVRLRLQSNYEGPVLREFNRNDLVLILGETDDFYAIQPPLDFPGFVFRTYVLDNVIEGNRVNVRLKPDLEAPVIAQLKSGDRVEGHVASANNKWLEIKLPDNARFYVAKEYIEKAGDVNFKARFERKKEEIYHLLNTTDTLSQAEMKKPFDQIMINGLKANYQHIIFDHPDFPDAGVKAKEALAALQEAYTIKKLDYLESQARASSSTVETNKKLAAEVQAHKNKISHLEQEIENGRQFASIDKIVTSNRPSQMPLNMSIWLPVEESLFNNWLQTHGRSHPQEFYDEQKQQGFVLKGIIDTYNRPVKNKPGDYMLLNSASKLPVAFLYSTHINLQSYVGHEVSIVVSPRDNHKFAFPAYFVLTLE